MCKVPPDHSRHHLAGAAITFALVLLALWMPSTQAASRPDYTIAVVPQFTSVAIHNFWSPLLEELGRRLDADFTLKHYANIPRFEADLLEGGPDLAFMNPYHAVLANKAQGYIPLVRDGNTELKGILVVRKDSLFQRLEDLAGSELVFPAPNAFGASLYMRALLAERHHLKFSARYVQSHGNVYRNVILGKANAGGGVLRTLSKEPAEIRNELRVLFTTPGVAPHPLAAHPRVPESMRGAILATLLEMGSTTTGKKLLAPTQLMMPIAADYQRDYLPLETLGLEHFAVNDE